MKERKNLTEGGIARTLFVLALPIVLGMFLQSAFNIIDTVFVGMLGPDELAAVAITFPVVFIFIAVASGLAVGSTILVSQSIGRKDMKGAANAAEHSLLLSGIIGIIIAVLGILFSEPLFVFMGADANVLPLTIAYSHWIFIGFSFLFIGFIGQGILQAEGDSKTPFIFNFIAILINVVLDAVLIFGLFGFPAMGIEGAAIATVIARSVGAGLILWFLYRGKAQTKIDLSPKYFKFDLGIAKRIFSLGIPASLGNITNSIGMLVMMSFIGGFGSYAIAAYGVGLRIDAVAMMPVVGLMSAMVAITGQNLGAGKAERVKKTAKVALAAVLGVMLAATAIVLSFPELLFGIFTSEAGVIEIGAVYLSIVAFAYLFRAVAMVFLGVLQGAGRTGLSAIVMALTWGIILVTAFFAGGIYGLSGIWYSILAGTVLFAIVSAGLFLSGVWIKPVAVRGMGKVKV